MEINNHPEYIEKVFEFNIPRNQAPERIDSYLARSILNATRTKVQKAIDAGFVEANGKRVKHSYKIQPGDTIVCRLMKPPPIELIPQDIPLNILFEDDCLLVIDKPAGMCSHPGYGNRSGTLVNAVLYHIGKREPIKYETDDEDDEIDDSEIYSSDFLRPGVVHRLDKDTSGIIVVSKNPTAHAALAKQFEDRTVQKMYRALVWGRIDDSSGRIEGNIGRSPRDRKLFDVVKTGGKYAATEYEVESRFDYLTLVRIRLLTGRTHQIRVHFKHIGHPVFGDMAYGGDKINYGGANKQFRCFAEKSIKEIQRQLLHAADLRFEHPETRLQMEFSSPLPNDFHSVVDVLEKGI
jgi:23S rRNA pseudouridine1911/1915/1917 synthase